MGEPVTSVFQLDVALHTGTGFPQRYFPSVATSAAKIILHYIAKWFGHTKRVRTF